MKYFYTKEKESRLVGSIAYSDEDIKTYLNGNIFIDHPQCTHENTAISNYLLSNPTWDNGELREKTVEERCEQGDFTGLLTGEIYEDGVIKTIPKPTHKYLEYEWKNFEWVQVTTKQDLMVKRKGLILEYKNKKNEITVLEELADEFESDETMEMLRTELNEIKANIDEILKLIKELGA